VKASDVPKLSASIADTFLKITNDDQGQDANEQACFVLTTDSGVRTKTY
jgi:hypothetical protein